MRLFSLLILFLSAHLSQAQTLNIPARDINALEGSEVVTAITPLSLHDRELYIKNEVLSGNIPDFQRNLVPIIDSALISGSYTYITYYVLPDYLALGSDTNYFLCPMTPILAQQLADSLDCLLPTSQMVDVIWEHAAVKMNPESIPPSPAMTTVPVFDDHNDMVKIQRNTFSNSLGELVSGNKKDVIISNQIYTSPPPARVVIYGWHYPNGNNIQPVYAGHIDTYADYSHGIRLVQNQCWVDGVPMLANQILTDPILHQLLSDEGVLSQPYYPDTSGAAPPNPPTTPTNFALTNAGATSLNLTIADDPNVSTYNVLTSNDGITFNLAGTTTSNTFTITALATNQITYVKLTASNVDGTSNQSEVLAATPSIQTDSILIVNAFDRNNTGNTKDFIRQHGTAFYNYGSSFSSATNDAVIEGLIDLNNYRVVDYVLGEESTVDETFNTAEQNLISAYLDQGGMLFVSGAEIGWDLDYLGSAADQDFYHNYLKAEYVQDAPNNQSSTYYQFETVEDTVFYGLGLCNFDDGNNGTYNVDYPDVITASGGAVNGLYYTGLANEYAGIYYVGLFPLGNEIGKLVHFAFPFETVYPDTKRFDLMQLVMEFFEDETTANDTTSAHLLTFNKQLNIYPNPAENYLKIEGINGQHTINIYAFDGRLIKTTNTSNFVDVSDLSRGNYLIQIVGTQQTLRFLKK